jgi:hypothetical protein
MRRALLACVISLVAAAPAAALAPTSPPKASLQGFVCQRATNSLDRVIAVIAVMRPVPGTQRMEMRFVLQRRPAGIGSFTTVQGGDLGHWLQPKPPTLGQRTSDVWRLRKLVANLVGPATYRFRVTFRWSGSSGVALDRTTLISEPCAEPR